MRKVHWALAFFMVLKSPLAQAVSTADLDAVFSRQQWGDTAETAYEILLKNPASSDAKIKGAYGLFQRGYPNAALLFLKRMNTSEWKNIPQGQDRFVEIVSYFQKKIPLTIVPGRLEQIQSEQASPELKDEIYFAKGRESFEKGEFEKAKTLLNSVAQGSRFFSQAKYILGTMAIKSGDYKVAESEFNRVFEPTVFQQSSEFWRDIGTQMTSNWGTNLRVFMNADSLNRQNRVAELSLLALARIAYAQKNLESALGRYSKVSPASAFFPRASLEKTWTLLALNRHDEAQAIAYEVSVKEKAFEAIEARIVRAIILVDAGRRTEARTELQLFSEAYEKSLDLMKHYTEATPLSSLPPFLQKDIAEDNRIYALHAYQDSLKEEGDRLLAEDANLFPVFGYLRAQLEPLMRQASELDSKLRREHIEQRKTDLVRLHTQSKLVLAEVFLDDREALRKEFNLQSDLSEEKQKNHDERLLESLNGAVHASEEAMALLPGKNLRLVLRQSELYWELGTAALILSQSSPPGTAAKLIEEGNQFKTKALELAQNIARSNPLFEKHAQALFFTGYAQLDFLKSTEGVQTLKNYVKTYPRHKFVPDTYRILGDREFDANHFHEAEEYYKKILEFPDSPIIGYAYYKVGWCAYNEKAFAKALLGLEKAITWANAAGANAPLLNLRSEAHRDLISIYAEVGDHRKAWGYFDQFFHGDSSQWILELAKQLDSFGQFEKSMDLYRHLIAASPQSPDNLTYQASVIKGAFKLRDYKLLMDSARELVDKYLPDIVQPQKEGSPAANAEAAFRDVVLAQHFEYRRAGVPEDNPRIKALDDLYLKGFGAWPQAQDPLYQHAYFLLKAKFLEEAATFYRRHWTQFEKILKEPLREEALRNYIHTLEEIENLKIKKETSEQKATNPEPIAITPNAQELLATTSLYAKLYPATTYSRPIAFLRSNILFHFERLEEAILEGQLLFDSDPADEFGKKSFHNLRFAYYRIKNWERTFKWSETLYEKLDSRLTSYKDDLRSIREESLFLWADQTIDPVLSAELFLKIAADPHMSRLHEKSLYNAFVRYQKADRRIEALATADELEKRFPLFPGVAQISGVRAAFYQEAGDYARALPFLDIFLKSSDKTVPLEALQQARLNAALISEALDRTAPALANYREVLATGASASPLTQEAKRAIQRMEVKAKSQDPNPFKKWDEVLKIKAAYESAPLGRSTDLATRIKKGGNQLEHIVNEFSEWSNNKETPQYYGFEIYCTLPFLYTSYSKAVLGLGKGDLELEKELAKVSGPIDSKAADLAGQCLDKSFELQHDGPYFRQVLESWGWRKNSEFKANVDRMQELLVASFPWLDPVKEIKNAQGSLATEENIIDLHMKGKATPETWLLLARVRQLNKKSALSRLTYVDALGKNPGSGPILNSLATLSISYLDKTPRALTPSFEKAAQSGSQAAWANLATLHLRGGRLEQAAEALKKGLEAGTFNEHKELKNKIKELFKK